MIEAGAVHGAGGPARVVVEGDRIVAVEPLRGRAPDRLLAPGFVDLQCNGRGRFDVRTAAGDDWDELEALQLAGGVTSWCPTLVTAPLDAYAARLARIPDGPTIAGVHLEGPFLTVPGAHRADWLRPPDLEWLAGLPDSVRIVTLAPELPGALDAIRLLSDRGVLVSVGHSAATEIPAGAGMVTHLFNGMPPFHHREPGLAGAALTVPVAVGLIADLVHVHPTALALAFAAKGPDRIALVTDAVPDGATRLPDGTLAGSAITLADAVRNVVRAAGVPWQDAVTAASTTPARLLGLADRGRIAPGFRADLVALTPDFEVEQVWLGGREARADARGGEQGAE